MATMSDVLIRPFGGADLVWAVPVLDRQFGGRYQARRGDMLDVLALPGFVATRGAKPDGLLTYRRTGGECELAFLWARVRNRGIGTALVRALRAEAADCTRIWVVTTNDNLDALRFYQRRGFALCALRAGAVDRSRDQLKPRIARVGAYGIPLRDELELELVTTGATSR
jgi:ribosomal protein S18 acetylase RimI-like enzyme